MHHLIISSPGHVPQKVRLIYDKYTIGRSVRADIILSDQFASRIHVKLKKNGNSYWLEDLKSINGTYCNGKSVIEPTLLKSGDIIHIGETDIEFVTAQYVKPKTCILIPDMLLSHSPEATINLSMVRTTDEIINHADQCFVYNPNQEIIQNSTTSKKEFQRDLLSIVSKVGVALLSNSELDEVLIEVMNIVFESLPVERGYLMIQPSSSCENFNLVCKVAKSRNEDVLTDEIFLSRYITEQVMSSRIAILTSNAQQDPRFAEQKSILLSGISSIMAVPLISETQIHGLIYVENPYDQRFTPEDLKVLTTVASVAVIKIENAQLLKERIEKQRLQEEIDLARKIQASMLPRHNPSNIFEFEVAGLSRPATGVSGDYYDYIRISDTHLAVVIGDVTGHGISSGLLMALAKGGLLNQVSTSSNVTDVMNAMNTLIFENGSRRDLMTFCYLLIDLQTGKVVLSNAGHPSPYIFHEISKTIKTIESGAYPLGVNAFTNYPIENLALDYGDTLVLYSDGIIELHNPKQEQFGYYRFSNLIKETVGETADKICESLIEGALNFAEENPPEDDITVVVIKRLQL